MGIYTQGNIPQELQAKLVNILTTLVSTFALAQRHIKHGRVWSFSRGTLLGNDDKLDAAIAKLDKLTLEESRLVGAETLMASKRAGRSLDELAVSMTGNTMTLQNHSAILGEVNQNMKQIRRDLGHSTQTMSGVKIEASNDKESLYQNRLKELLRPSVYTQDTYDHINRKRVAGTGHWIRNEPLFRSWIEGRNPFLWISGIPGAGKTYLSASIVSFLQERPPKSVQRATDISMGYFFFQGSNPETRSFLRALTNASYQISQTDSVYAEYIYSNCQSQEDFKTIKGAWRNLFTNFFFCEKYSDHGTYLILDGVDEAFEPECKEFIELLKDLDPSGHQSGCIQLVMIGRPQLFDQLNEAVVGEYLPNIHVSERKTSNDVRCYILTSIERSKTLKLVSRELKTQITSILYQRAQGMFLWVDLMLQELYRKKRASSILDALEKAPQGLNQMFKHVLNNYSMSLQDDDPKDLNQLLAWVTCAGRPLKLGELDTILRLESASGDGLFSLESALRTQFAALFTLTREDGLTTADLQHIAAQNTDFANAEGQGAEDPELERLYGETITESDPFTTVVTFCHASVGDFFRHEAEGRISAGECFPTIGIDFIEAKISICRTCLALLCSGSSQSQAQDTNDIVRYAADMWYYHLSILEHSNTSRENRQAIGKSLIRMLRDERAIALWAGSVSHLFFCKRSLMTILLWLEDASVSQVLSVEEHDWMEESLKSPASIFTTVTSFIAAQWLQHSYWVAETCFTIVHASIRLQKGESLNLDVIEPETGEKISSKEIIQTAEWADFAKNALWYRRVAITMREYGIYDTAVNCFEESLRLETIETQGGFRLVPARAGIAIIHARQGNWDEAIKLDLTNQDSLITALKTEPGSLMNEIKRHLHQVQERLAKSYWDRRDYQNALKYFEAAFANEKSCYKCAFRLASELIYAKKDADLISMLLAMREKLPGTDHTRLDEFIMGSNYNVTFIPQCAIAARETGQVQLLTDILLESATVARRQLKMAVAIDLELMLARLYRNDLKEVEKAMRIWDRLIRTLPLDLKKSTYLGFARQEAVENSAFIYFMQALSAPRNSHERSSAASSLERLAKSTEVMTEATEIDSSTRAGLFLGQLYAHEGRTEDAHICFKTFVQRAIQMYGGDDESENDFTASLALADALLSAGHDADAIAVFQALFPETEPEDDSIEIRHVVAREKAEDAEIVTKSQSEEETNEETAKPSPVSRFFNSEQSGGYHCDGRCRETYHNFHGAAVCRFCHSRWLCQDCLKWFREEKITMGECTPDHDWLVVPVLKTVPKEETIVVSGETLSWVEFRRRVSEEWKL